MIRSKKYLTNIFLCLPVACFIIVLMTIMLQDPCSNCEDNLSICLLTRDKCYCLNSYRECFKNYDKNIHNLNWLNKTKYCYNYYKRDFKNICTSCPLCEPDNNCNKCYNLYMMTNEPICIQITKYRDCLIDEYNNKTGCFTKATKKFIIETVEFHMCELH